MTKCIHCDATVLSSSQPERMGAATPAGCVCQACQRSLAVKSITGTAGMCCECVKGGFPLAAAPALCSDCPPVGYPTDKTRCDICPRHSAPAAPAVGGEAMVLHPLSEIREWDEALRELGIQDSTTTPAEAVRELNTEIERLRAPTHQPIAYRWRQPGNKHWIYDPTPEWIEDHKHEIELDPLYTAPPASPLRGWNRDLIALDAAHQIEALPSDLHEAQKTARIQLIVLDAMASPPEQPARPQPMFSGDRDPLKSIVEWTKEVAEQPAAAPDKER